MDSEGVLMPLIHEHRMMPLKTSYMECCHCCGRYEINTEGYKCESCNFFICKSCAESSESIQHPSHPGHTLQLRRKGPERTRVYRCCDLCGKEIGELYYHCEICDFDMDLYCTKYPPPEVIDISEMHHHKLILLKELSKFDCAACRSTYDNGFPYKCHECDLAFHVECVWHPSELQLNHSYHPLHPLNPHTRYLAYSDGKCSLCEHYTDRCLFYHCSLCNFTVDVRCVKYPPPKAVLNLKAHGHELTLLLRFDPFTCNACGLKGDRSPYVCLPCGFMIHQACLHLPRVININRHDHRVSRTSILGIVNSVCGVCRQKVDWTRGGFSCQKCPGYVVHSKCATRKDVWNGEELEGVLEETEDIEPFVVIDENTIQHFSHKEHYLRLHVNDVLCDDNKRCRACTHPICLQSFYACDSCDFILHQNCAGFLRKKRHFLHNDRLPLVADGIDYFKCNACRRACNGFMYQHGGKAFDVRCISISEPFFYPSHHDHPLYSTSPGEKNKKCNGCNFISLHSSVLKCIELNCEFVLCFHCATLPFVVKHRIDDHPLSLCYGEKWSGTYWCDICETESDPRRWFYTCKDHRASLHTKCVLGDYSHLMPRSTIKVGELYYDVVLNNSVSRPVCIKCKLHCIYPIILKKFGTSDEYICCQRCLND